MNCATCERHLSAYVDDEVNVALRQEMEMHLDLCAACRADLQEHLAAWEAALQVLPGQAPEGLWHGVAEALGESPAAGADLEEVALLLRGLAGQVQDLHHEVRALRRQVAEGAWSEDREPEDIRVTARAFAGGRSRQASIAQLRRTS
jgi:anti-sigma factor RsiW